MSVEALALVLHHSEASGTAKLVLVGIANHDGDGGAWPAIATLAKYARVSESAVHRAITKLVELGEVKVQQNAGGTATTRADRRPNRYEILVVCPPACDGTTQHGVASTPPRDGDGVPSVKPRGSARAPHGVARVAPEPSLEPPKEPSDAATAAPSPRSSRDAVKQRADGLTRAWWESRTPRPLQNFVGLRKLVEKALRAGHTTEAVMAALRACQDDPPLVGWKIEKALATHRNKQHDPRGLNYDR